MSNTADWLADTGLVKTIALMRKSGATWHRIQEYIGQQGYPIPSDISVRRHLKKQEKLAGMDGHKWLDEYGPSGLPKEQVTHTSWEDIKGRVNARSEEKNTPPVTEPHFFAPISAKRNEGIEKALRAAHAQMDEEQWGKEEVSDRITDALAGLRVERRALADERDMLHDMAKDLINYKSPDILIPRSVGPHEDDMIVLCSDWHLGAKVDEADHLPGSAFNKVVAEGRLETLMQQMAVQAENLPHRRKLYLVFLGDITDGSNMRAGHGLRVDMSLGHQRTFASQHIKRMVVFAKGLGFVEIVIIWLTGNHGRVGHRLGDDLAVDNHEYALGELVDRMVEPLGGVTVVRPQSRYFRWRIGAKVWMGEHGDSKRGGSGITPVAGMTRLLEDRIRMYNCEAPDVFVTAHFHTPFVSAHGDKTRMFGNGAFPAMDDYAGNEIRKVTRPSQWILVQNDNDGIYLSREAFLAEHLKTVEPKIY